MKRHSITAIIDKCMQLTIRTCFEKSNSSYMITRIKKAAVNEIIRLEAEKESSQEFICGSLKPVKD